MGIAQAEVRELRRIVESTTREGENGRETAGDLEANVEWFGEHPLGHLIDADVE